MKVTQHIFFDPLHKEYQKLKEDLPEPDRPVITTNLSLGRSTSMFFKLCCLANVVLFVSFLRKIECFRP